MVESTPLTYGVHLTDAGATAAFGAVLAQAIRQSGSDALLVTLSGDLGAGKTSLVRGILRGFGHDGAVPSPTYALLEPYRFGDIRINHLDLYRLAGGDELEFLGWRDIESTIRLVEWPERVAGLAEQADLAVSMKLAGEGRDLMLEAGGDPGRAVVQALLTN